MHFTAASSEWMCSGWSFYAPHGEHFPHTFLVLRCSSVIQFRLVVQIKINTFIADTYLWSSELYS